jgi:hypothetical protein
MKLVTTDTTVSTRFTGRVSGILLAVLFLVGLGNISFKTHFEEPLYLIEQASYFVLDTDGFSDKVRDVATDLDVQPEWLMAVMYNESKFDKNVENLKGSGATGLIQWMPKTAKELGTTTKRLKEMTHEEQLDYVYKYFDLVKRRYRPLENLTDTYLAVLYPKALNAQSYFAAQRLKHPGVKRWGRDFNTYVLYASPSKAYKQNIGLDEDRDGKVTIFDIEAHVQRKYPSAFAATKRPTPEQLLAVMDSAKAWAADDVMDELETRGEELGIEFLKTYAHQILLNVERHRQKKVDGIASK